MLISGNPIFNSHMIYVAFAWRASKSSLSTILHYFICPWLWNHKLSLFSTKLSKPKGFTMFHHIAPADLATLVPVIPPMLAMKPGGGVQLVGCDFDGRSFWPWGLGQRNWFLAMFQELQVRAGEGLDMSGSFWHVFNISKWFQCDYYDSIHFRKGRNMLPLAGILVLD